MLKLTQGEIIKHLKYYLLVFFSLLFILGDAYVAKALIVFGTPLLFAVAFFAEIILFGVFIYAIVRSSAQPGNIIKSLSKSIWGGLVSNDYVSKIIKSRSPIILWSKRRLDKNNPYGLVMTISLLLSAFFLFNFFGVLINVASKGSFTSIDVRVLNLIPSIRTPSQTTFFRIITTLANIQTIIIATSLLCIIFWRKNQKLLTGFVALILIGEEGVAFVVKNLVGRARPEQYIRIISEDGFSFPSGHVLRATVIFGLITYFVYKSYKSNIGRLIAVGIYIMTIFMVAISRIYLGVHYPSDVWGSFLLGASLLMLIIGVLEISSRYNVIKHKKIKIDSRIVLIVPLVIVLFSIIGSGYFVHIKETNVSPSYSILPVVNEKTIKKLPLYSETLTGSKMEPINFIYAGYENQIINIFQSHGWFKADPSTLSNTIKAIAVGFQGGQYLNAPVTPSYLNFKPETFAFEQSTQTHSLRQRHHTRIWRSDFVLPDGRPIWVATASFDEGVELAGSAKIPTHHIDPNIDAERAFITQSLGVESKLIKVVDPQIGKNASGDSFFTDGNAQIIFLK